MTMQVLFIIRSVSRTCAFLMKYVCLCLSVGFVGLNNIKANDYCNVILQVMSFSYFFCFRQTSGNYGSYLKYNFLKSTVCN
jgi:hypothetical protein